MKKLTEPYFLKEAQKNFYRENRFIKLKNVLDSETVKFFNEKISAKVNELIKETRPMAERSVYDQAFLQLFNLWRIDEEIKELVFSKRLAGIAAELMELESVRLYHDQALFKEKGGGITPWHADQYYWPLETDKTVTAWIPLQETPLEMGPLEFSAGSHKIVEGRDLEIGEESENFIGKRLRVTDFNHVVEPFDIGEVSFHSGWIFHRAGANTTNSERRVMTIIYMDSEMRLKEPTNEGQLNDWKKWCPGATVGEVINTDLNPVLYGS